MPKFREYIFGSKDKIKNQQLYSPEQQAYINQMLQGAQGGTQNVFDYINSILSNDPEAYADFEAPYMQQFNEEIIPNILERFSGMGARSSSAVNQTLGKAGENLQMQLAAMRANLKNQAINQLMGYGQQGLTQQTQPYVQQGMQGVASPLLQGFGQAVGSAIGGGFNPLAIFNSFGGGGGQKPGFGMSKGAMGPYNSSPSYGYNNYYPKYGY